MEKNQIGMIVMMRRMKMIWKKVTMMLYLQKRMKMFLHLLKIVDEKERVAKVENQVSPENLVNLENLENPVNPSLQKDLKTLLFQIIRFLFQLFL